MAIKENNGLKQDNYVSSVIWLLWIIISILALTLIRFKWSTKLLIRLLGGSSYPTPGGQKIPTTPYDENYDSDREEADIEQVVSIEEIDTDEDEICFRRQLKFLNIMKLTPTYVCYNIRYIISDINYFRKRRNNEENADKLSEIFFSESAVAECAVADEKDISDIILIGILKPINILDIILIVGRQWFILNCFKKQKVMIELSKSDPEYLDSRNMGFDEYSILSVVVHLIIQPLIQPRKNFTKLILIYSKIENIINIDGQSLAEVDIQSSQPSILGLVTLGTCVYWSIYYMIKVVMINIPREYSFIITILIFLVFNGQIIEPANNLPPRTTPRITPLLIEQGLNGKAALAGFKLETVEEEEPEHYLPVILLFSFALRVNLDGFYQNILTGFKLIDAVYLDCYASYVAGALIRLDDINGNTISVPDLIQVRCLLWLEYDIAAGVLIIVLINCYNYFKFNYNEIYLNDKYAKYNVGLYLLQMILIFDIIIFGLLIRNCDIWKGYSCIFRHLWPRTFISQSLVYINTYTMLLLLLLVEIIFSMILVKLMDIIRKGNNCYLYEYYLVLYRTYCLGLYMNSTGRREAYQYKGDLYYHQLPLQLQPRVEQLEIKLIIIVLIIYLLFGIWRIKLNQILVKEISYNYSVYWFTMICLNWVFILTQLFYGIGEDLIQAGLKYVVTIGILIGCYNYANMNCILSVVLVKLILIGIGKFISLIISCGINSGYIMHNDIKSPRHKIDIGTSIYQLLRTFRYWLPCNFAFWLLLITSINFKGYFLGAVFVIKECLQSRYFLGAAMKVVLKNDIIWKWILIFIYLIEAIIYYVVILVKYNWILYGICCLRLCMDFIINYMIYQQEQDSYHCQQIPRLLQLEQLKFELIITLLFIFIILGMGVIMEQYFIYKPRREMTSIEAEDLFLKYENKEQQKQLNEIGLRLIFILVGAFILINFIGIKNRSKRRKCCTIKLLLDRNICLILVQLFYGIIIERNIINSIFIFYYNCY